MIVSREEKVEKRIEVDLTGPEGNSFYLIGLAVNLARTLNQRRAGNYIDTKALQTEMTSGDYENLIQVMEKYFGHMIIMYR